MISLKEYREPTHRLPDYLTWGCLIAPGVVLQKGCVLQKTVEYRGPDLDAALPAELMSAAIGLNSALKRLGGGWSFFCEAQSSETRSYPESTWPTVASRIFDEERRMYFGADGAHFESRYYLTFVWALPTDHATRLSTLFYDTDESDDDEVAEVQSVRRDLAHFQKEVGDVVHRMCSVFADVRALSDDETLTYLHSTISTHRHPVRTPSDPSYLDAFLPDEPFTPGDTPMLGGHFVPCCTIVDFPMTTVPGVLDRLNRVGVEYRWMTRFICMGRDEAKKILERKRRHWYTKRKSILALIKEEATKQESALIDNSAGNFAQDADAALQELGADFAAFGYLTTTLVVWDKDEREALRKQRVVAKAVRDCGFIVREETLNSTAAWLGSLPGHVYANIRRPIVNTVNLAHMMPVSAVWAGDAYNEHLAKATGLRRAHIYCSSGTTPFRFNTTVDDLGHMLIVGPPGSGKSTLLSTLCIQWLKYPRARIVIFDKHRSARAATLANGGICYEPGNASTSCAFQPLARIDEPAERVWAAQLVGLMLELQKVSLTPAVQKAIDDSLTLMASNPDRTLRNMTVLASKLGSYMSELRAALRPYTVEGNFGQIFDADHEDFRCGNWTMIEMGHLMRLGSSVILPALEYLFHRVEEQFDGRPTLLVLDEAWLFMTHAVFAKRLQEWFKTLRKANVYVVFATQEIEDVMATVELLKTILSACQTQVLLPSKSLGSTPALAEAYRNIGLSEREIELLGNAEPKRDYYYRSAKGKRLFSLSLGPVGLAFVGKSTPADQQFLDEMVATRAPADYALAMLERSGVKWAIQEARGA